jgi:pimeloyl-ACP methyl ester carboxylesterase
MDSSISRLLRHRRGAAAACGAALLLLAGSVPAAQAQDSSLSNPTCTDYTVPVAITATGPTDFQVWGQLCYRGPVVPGTVQLLVHGATYNDLYWNLPYGDGAYSYVDAATLSGYATFDIDRIGAGRSSHPVSTEVGLEANAVSLHDVVSALRTGAVGGRPFTHVIYVGHSFGSIFGWEEEEQYHDVSAMILTGATHVLAPGALSELESDSYPAADDPRFADSGLDSGYLTTQPGTREALFYDPTTTDPAALAEDEATKDTTTVQELEDYGALYGLPAAQQPSQQIDVPVLLVLGQEDRLFCQGVTQYNCADPASVRQYESQFYPPQADLQVVTVPDTGHALALSTTAPVTDAAMLAWSWSVIAP